MSIIDYFILFALLISIVLLLFIIRERFDQCVNLTEKFKLKMFFPKKFQENQKIETITKEYFSKFNTINEEDLIKNMIFERLKFQREFFKKIRLFRVAVIFIGIYAILFVLKLFPISLGI